MIAIHYTLFVCFQINPSINKRYPMESRKNFQDAMYFSMCNRNDKNLKVIRLRLETPENKRKITKEPTQVLRIYSYNASY